LHEQIGDVRIIRSDPTSSSVCKFQKEISRLKKEEKIDVKTFHRLDPSDEVCPRLYGLLKAHKPEKNYPMRTVVSISHGTSAFLVDLIQPTLDKNGIPIKNWW